MSVSVFRTVTMNQLKAFLTIIAVLAKKKQLKNLCKVNFFKVPYRKIISMMNRKLLDAACRI